MSDQKIAPHFGKELSMVLNYEKPMGVVSREKDPEQYRDVLANVHRLEVRQYPKKEIAFAPKMTGRYVLREYDDLRMGRAKVDSQAEYQRRMGRLFGYTEEEIEEFIKGNLNCGCENCVGVNYKFKEKKLEGTKNKGHEKLTYLEKVEKLHRGEYTAQKRKSEGIYMTTAERVAWVEQTGHWL